MNGEGQLNNTEKGNLATSAENRYIAFSIINKTNIAFTMESFDIMRGKWANEPVSIPANASKILAFKACGRADSPGGTEGWIRYSSEQGKVKFTTKWYVPYSDPNTLSIVSEGEKCNFYQLTVENFNASSQAIDPLLTISKK